MGWIASIIVILLALYGWVLIFWLAKRREAHDLYSSTIPLLEQLEIEGEQAWSAAPGSLGEYTERRLTSKLAAIEQRVGLIQRHYRSFENSSEIAEEIQCLHEFLTAASDLLPAGESRSTAIHRHTTELIRLLLEADYEHINKRPRLFPQFLYEIVS